MIAWFLQKTQLKRLGFSLYMSNTKNISDSKLFFVPGSKYLNRSDFLGASLEDFSKVSHTGTYLIKQMQSVKLIFFILGLLWTSKIPARPPKYFYRACYWECYKNIESIWNLCYWIKISKYFFKTVSNIFKTSRWSRESFREYTQIWKSLDNFDQPQLKILSQYQFLWYLPTSNSSKIQVL